jgi:hypothetical protein
VYGYDTRKKLSFRLWQYTTIFQAEVSTIKACAIKNINRGYKNGNTDILSDSQAVIKAHDKYHINSKLVWNCLLSLNITGFN